MTVTYTEIVSMIMKKDDIQNVLDCASKLFDAALIFVNREMELLAYSKSFPPRDEIWKDVLEKNTLKNAQDGELLQTIASDKFVNDLHENITSGFSYPPDNKTIKFFVRFNVKGGFSSFVIIALPNTDDFSLEKQSMLRSFAWLVAQVYFKNHSLFSGSIYSASQNSLLNALNSPLDSPNPGKQEQQENCPFRDVHILAVAFESAIINNTIWIDKIKKINEIIHNSSATVYENHIVAFSPMLSGKQLEQLEQFCEQSNARIGISWRFSGEYHVMRHYKQACFSIETAIAIKNQNRICPYDEYFIYGIFHECRADKTWASTMPPLLNCLQQYDAKKQTKLYETFESYLKNNSAFAETASRLSIHKSTLRHRLDIIHDMASDLDLSDPYIYASLLISFAVNKALENDLIDNL